MWEIQLEPTSTSLIVNYLVSVQHAAFEGSNGKGVGVLGRGLGTKIQEESPDCFLPSI